MQSLTLTSVAEWPETVTTVFCLHTGEEIVFRPLIQQDEEELAVFFASLSKQTRYFFGHSGNDRDTARGMCEAINRYYKLQMVALADGRVVALFQFSLTFPECDIERFRSYEISLEETDIRFGSCIADAYQNMGLGSRLFPLMADIARRFGKKRMILWGGVLVDNPRAIHYYEKHGFRIVGEYLNQTNGACHDATMDLPVS